MTLPHVLAYALKRRTGKPEARYVFGLGEWCIEDTRDRDSLIVTLKTTLPALFELLPVPIPQQTLYARNDSTWCASFSSVW